MPEADKARHQRIARRWAEQDDLRLYEWAAEYGVDYRMLFRAARSIGLCDSFGNPAEVHA